MEFETEANSTDKSQPFEIKAEDITERDDKPRPYLCTVCDKRFTRKDNLNKHKQIHSGNYKCTDCGKCCGSSYNLNRHMRVHTGDKPYKCSLCNKSYRASNNLRTHKGRVHSNSNRRPHHCPDCGKTFVVNSYLKRHLRAHTGVKPYSCRHCLRNFTRLDQLNTHLLKSHNEGTCAVCNICHQKCVICCFIGIWHAANKYVILLFVRFCTTSMKELYQ